MTALAGIADDARRLKNAARQLEHAAREFTARTGEPVYLVGGSVRDALLGVPVADFDLALSWGEEEFARALARSGFGTPFRLSGSRQRLSVWRVAGAGVVADVARFPGKSGIFEDLARRDFTVNAMARDLAGRQILDPFGGRRDLGRGLVRAVSDTNLRDDPLRVLRAYRLAASHGWRIVSTTRRSLQRAAGALSRVSPERIEQEISRLFSSAVVSSSLGMAGRDGVLAAAFEIEGDWSRACRPSFLRALDRWPEPGAARLAGRLAILFSRLGAPAEAVRTSLERLRFARTLVRTVLSRMALLAELIQGTKDTRSTLFEHREEWPSVRLFLRRAARGAAEKRRLVRLLSASRTCRFSKIPVDGDDIERWLGIPPGPAVGRALEEARRRYFAREWNGRREIREGLLSGELPIDRTSRVE